MPVGTGGYATRAPPHARRRMGGRTTSVRAWAGQLFRWDVSIGESGVPGIVGADCEVGLILAVIFAVVILAEVATCIIGNRAIRGLPHSALRLASLMSVLQRTRSASRTSAMPVAVLKDASKPS